RNWFRSEGVTDAYAVCGVTGAHVGVVTNDVGSAVLVVDLSVRQVQVGTLGQRVGVANRSLVSVLVVGLVINFRVRNDDRASSRHWNVCAHQPGAVVQRWR